MSFAVVDGIVEISITLTSNEVQSKFSQLSHALFKLVYHLTFDNYTGTKRSHWANDVAYLQI